MAEDTETTTDSATKAAAKAAAKAPDAPPVPPAPLLPEKIRLLGPHGFIDEEGRNRSWPAGDVISDPEEIALLVERKARHEAV